MRIDKVDNRRELEAMGEINLTKDLYNVATTYPNSINVIRESLLYKRNSRIPPAKPGYLTVISV